MCNCVQFYRFIFPNIWFYTIDIVSLRTLNSSSDAYSDTILGYANSIRTIDGGTHIDGLKASLTRTLNNLGKKSKVLKVRVLACTLGFYLLAMCNFDSFFHFVFIFPSSFWQYEYHLFINFLLNSITCFIIDINLECNKKKHSFCGSGCYSGRLKKFNQSQIIGQCQYKYVLEAN